MDPYGYYALAAAIVLFAAIIWCVDRRSGWKDGVNFARQMAHREACIARELYNNAVEIGEVQIARQINAQVEILRAFEMKLRWEMAARFISPEKMED